MTIHPLRSARNIVTILTAMSLILVPPLIYRGTTRSMIPTLVSMIVMLYKALMNHLCLLRNLRPLKGTSIFPWLRMKKMPFILNRTMKELQSSVARMILGALPISGLVIFVESRHRTPSFQPYNIRTFSL
ncbi:hypothetical protein C8R42DRAFT_681775 [Lentinula raphanica]|nr:hypothetical protein C8R42DRAFT_681775 [Lentinula raphanica]